MRRYSFFRSSPELVTPMPSTGTAPAPTTRVVRRRYPFLRSSLALVALMPSVGAAGAGTPITGSLNKTLGTLTATGAGQLAITGALDKTLGSLTATGAGMLAITGAANITLGALTVAGSGGASPNTGALDQTLGALTLVGTGTLTSGSGISGVAAITLGALTASGAGQLTITGSLNVTLGALTILHGRPDSSSIDAAIVAALRADATLAGLLPDGVYFDVAPAQAKRFVLVSLIDEHDEATFSKGRTYEDALYLVKGVALSTLAVNMRTVAARIDAVLEDVELVATGFTFMDSCREARVRLTEIDDLDTSIQWHHRGGHYRVRMALE